MVTSISLPDRASAVVAKSLLAALSPAAASSSLGVAVESIAAATIDQTVLGAPSPPPLPGNGFELNLSSGGVVGPAVGGAAAAALCALCALCAVWYWKRRSRQMDTVVAARKTVVAREVQEADTHNKDKGEGARALPAQRSSPAAGPATFTPRDNSLYGGELEELSGTAQVASSLI